MVDATCWACPGFKLPEVECAGGELYCDVTSDGWAADPWRDVLTEASQQLNMPSPTNVVWLFKGSIVPQTIQFPADAIEVYLQPSSDPPTPDQTLFQLGHEATHVLCGPRIVDWSHETVAVLFSLKFLRQRGYANYAAQEEEALLDEDPTPIGEFLGWHELPAPPGLYGRAYRTGTDLGLPQLWLTPNL